MTSTGLWFLAVGQICAVGLLAALAKPAWFRLNGKVPSRWKIGTIWLLLAAVCGIGTMANDGTAPASTPTEATVSEPMDAATVDTDIAMPAEQPEPQLDDAAMDASSPIDATPEADPPPKKEAAPVRRRSAR